MVYFFGSHRSELLLRRAVRMITDKDIYVAVGGYRSVHHLFRSVGIEEVCLHMCHSNPILL